MNISIVGTGYVGLVSGACFAEMGIDVTCVDIDEKKIGRLLSGEVPIYEPGLDDLVRRNVEAGRLHFTTDLSSCLDQVEVVFSAVGTPPDEDGSADLRYVLEVARTFGRNINKYTILVTKSTVPVGTSKKVKAVIQEELDRRGVQIPFEVASNPEFLKEGAAIKDFMSPDRIVVGTESERAQRLLSRLYRPFLVNNFRIYFMDIPSAEMTKYAANAMLATRISFMNDIANLCDKVGADIDMVRKGSMVLRCGSSRRSKPSTNGRRRSSYGNLRPNWAICAAGPSPCGGLPSSPKPTICAKRPPWWRSTA